MQTVLSLSPSSADCCILCLSLLSFWCMSYQIGWYVPLISKTPTVVSLCNIRWWIILLMVTGSCLLWYCIFHVLWATLSTADVPVSTGRKNESANITAHDIYLLQLVLHLQNPWPSNRPKKSALCALIYIGNSSLEYCCWVESSPSYWLREPSQQWPQNQIQDASMAVLLKLWKSSWDLIYTERNI